jgi:Ca2+-binding RTX toxin-like protein
LRLVTKALLVMAAVAAVALPQSVGANDLRLAIDNPLSTNAGADINLAVADVVTGGVAITEPTKAAVSATIDPNSVGTSYYFEYGPNGDLTLRTPTVSLGAGLNPREVVADLLDITPGQTYDFRPVVVGAAGVSKGALQSFATSGPAAAPSTSKSSCTIKGTARSDVLRGTKKRDVICGLGGNDKIRSMGGNDVIRGGAGKDRVSGGAGKDRLSGSSGADKLYGQAGNDTLAGGKGNDTLAGGKGRDSVNGGPGRDRVVVQGRDKLRSAERVSRRH